MRRSPILSIVGAVLVIGFGAYSVFWWIAAGRIKEAAAETAQAAPRYNIENSWKTMRVAGYPFAFRLELSDVVVRSSVPDAPSEYRAPAIWVSVAPWDFHSATFGAPDGLEAMAGPAGAPIVKLSAAKASGAVAMTGDGGGTLWLSLYDMTATSGERVSARVLHTWISMPGSAPSSHSEPAGAVAALARDLAVPAPPPGFGKTIDELAFAVTVMGPIKAGPPRESAAAWRDAGGTLELDQLHLSWGQMAVNGSGTLALDNDLQPVGGFSGAISGYDQLMTALVAAGRVKPNDARVARLALAMIAKAGPDGRPEIATSFTIQSGQMFLGPAKLGKVPRIEW